MTARALRDPDEVAAPPDAAAATTEARSWFALGVVALAGFVLTTWAVATRMPIPLDGTLLDASSRLSAYLSDWRFLSDSANLPLIAVGVGIVAWMLFAGRRREMWLVIVALVLVTAGSEAVKLLVARPRPDADPTALGVVYSYPSGHVLEAMTIYGIICLTLWRSRLPSIARVAVVVGLMVLVALVGVARVVMHAHYPSDVIGGALAGIGVVAIYAGLTLPRREPPPGPEEGVRDGLTVPSHGGARLAPSGRDAAQQDVSRATRS